MNEVRYYQKNLMIVDDDPDIVLSLQELFEREGFQVTTADNGRNCLVELEKGFQGIIILDLMMPIMDGIETIKKMTIDGFTDSNTIIVLTAKRIQGEEFNDIYPYIADYITKPFDINTLISTIKKIAMKPPMKRRY
ncbi:MAG: response regulator receiver domain protein (CheY-like) [Thermoplasmatales archaeon]|nr:response regulator receiver domain protein (CheY-like) [Thermoplasmatales archaeon]